MKQAPKTRSSRVPTATSACASCRRLAYDFALSLSEGATLIEAVADVNDPAFDFGAHLVGLVESGAVASIIPGRIVMIADAAHAPPLAPSNPIARLTSVVFGLVPPWLPLLILRLALARPFFASGLTRWDGWFTLSFGTKILFAQDYMLHIFGAEIPFPMPDLVAAMASTAEIVLPILLAFGLLTRWAALGLLCMTAVIQLTYPDGWANFHLLLGGDGARDPHLRPGRDLARPAARPRRLEREAHGLAPDCHREHNAKRLRGPCAHGFKRAWSQPRCFRGPPLSKGRSRARPGSAPRRPHGRRQAD